MYPMWLEIFLEYLSKMLSQREEKRIKVKKIC